MHVLLIGEQLHCTVYMRTGYCIDESSLLDLWYPEEYYPKEIRRLGVPTTQPLLFDNPTPLLNPWSLTASRIEGRVVWLSIQWSWVVSSFSFLLAAIIRSLLLSLSIAPILTFFVLKNSAPSIFNLWTWVGGGCQHTICFVIPGGALHTSSKRIWLERAFSITDSRLREMFSKTLLFLLPHMYHAMRKKWVKASWSLIYLTQTANSKKFRFGFTLA